ncbi:MAG: hypothetical protein HKO66_01440 [Saprospiraceae bacterium]|nr:hypothetical protein [Bacteroidia bacterium]NNE15549.1 hypothetical protein [Saprospiraceae bacterium]NNL90873.1 hypothetical protein [Saprospiraceae bacterium]
MKNLVFLALVLLFACSPEAKVNVIETVERFKVNQFEDSLAISKLEFKESKIFNNKDQLIERHSFDVNGRLKGFEKLTYNNGNADSKYFTSDSMMLSYYEYHFEHDILLEKKAYDASDSTLVRTEEYNYDEAGNLIEKIIVNSDGMIAQVYKFAYDKFGNELGFSVFDSSGKMILIESHRIVELDQKNRWTKKYSERKGIVRSYYTRKFSKINIGE